MASGAVSVRAKSELDPAANCRVTLQAAVPAFFTVVERTASEPDRNVAEAERERTHLNVARLGGWAPEPAG